MHQKVGVLSLDFISPSAPVARSRGDGAIRYGIRRNNFSDICIENIEPIGNGFKCHFQNPSSNPSSSNCQTEPVESSPGGQDDRQTANVSDGINVGANCDGVDGSSEKFDQLIAPLGVRRLRFGMSVAGRVVRGLS